MPLWVFFSIKILFRCISGR